MEQTHVNDAADYGQTWAEIYDDYPAHPSAADAEPAADLLADAAHGGKVLEFGVGTGRIALPLATRGLDVTGVDISARQIELARAAVPEARFIHADMTALDLPASSLDAVVAFYSLTHVPRGDLPDLLEAILRWLRSGGVFVATLGAQDSPDAIEDDWLGTPMFFSHYGAKKNRALIRRAGFEIEIAAVEEEPEDRHGALFLWVIARKPEERDADA
jgi:SAM-dependent methyltransferase